MIVFPAQHDAKPLQSIGDADDVKDTVSSPTVFRRMPPQSEILKNLPSSETESFAVQPATLKPRRIIFPSLHLSSTDSPGSSSCESLTPAPSSPPEGTALHIEGKNLPSFPSLERSKISGLDYVLALSPLRWASSLAEVKPMLPLVSPAPHGTDHILIGTKQNPDSIAAPSPRPNDVSVKTTGGKRNPGCSHQRIIISHGANFPAITETAKELEFKNPKPLRSILRTKSCGSQAVIAVSSVESDLPSLASSNSQSSLEDSNHMHVCFLPPMKHFSRRERAVSEPPYLSRVISFDARVRVKEFERAQAEREVTWYTMEELEVFKMDAVKLIMAKTESAVIPTGTGRTVRRRVFPTGKAFFSHKALAMEDDEESSCRDAVFRCAVLKNEVRRILVVDPYDICLQLFSKALKITFPDAEIETARNAEEAMQRVRDVRGGQRFDIVLIEERLRTLHQQHRNAEPSQLQTTLTGSSLMRTLSAEMSKSVFVGTSAHLPQDGSGLKESGADFLWSKPPPLLTPNLLDSILRTLLEKRERHGVIKDLFGS